MYHIEKMISVNVPARTAFLFISEPLNLLTFWPGMIEVSDVERQHNGGWNFRCIAKMANARFQYATQCVEYVVNQSITNTFSGGVHGTIQWQFIPDGENTTVTFCMDYAIPIPLLKHQTEAAIIRQNEADSDALMRNLKLAVEKHHIVHH